MAESPKEYHHCRAACELPYVLVLLRKESCRRLRGRAARLHHSRVALRAALSRHPLKGTKAEWRRKETPGLPPGRTS